MSTCSYSYMMNCVSIVSRMKSSKSSFRAHLDSTTKPVQRAERPEREPSPARSASAGTGTSPSVWKASGVCGCCEPGTARAPVVLSSNSSALSAWIEPGRNSAATAELIEHRETFLSHTRKRPTFLRSLPATQIHFAFAGAGLRRCGSGLLASSTTAARGRAANSRGMAVAQADVDCTIDREGSDVGLACETVPVWPGQSHRAGQRDLRTQELARIEAARPFTRKGRLHEQQRTPGLVD